MKLFNYDVNFKRVIYPSELSGFIAMEVEVSIDKVFPYISAENLSLFNFGIDRGLLYMIYGSGSDLKKDVDKLNKLMMLKTLQETYQDAFNFLQSGAVTANMLYSFLLRSNVSTLHDYLIKLKAQSALLNNSMYPIGIYLFDTPSSDGKYYVRSVRLIVIKKIESSMDILKAQDEIVAQIFLDLFPTFSHQDLIPYSVKITFSNVYAQGATKKDDIQIVQNRSISLINSNLLPTELPMDKLKNVLLNSDSTWLKVYGELIPYRGILLEWPYVILNAKRVGYILERRTKDGDYKYVCTVPEVLTTNSYIDEDMKDNTSYSYRLTPIFYNDADQKNYGVVSETGFFNFTQSPKLLDIKIKDEYDFKLSDFKSVSPISDVVKDPFMFELYTYGIASKHNYDSFLEVSGNLVSFIKEVHNLHKAVVKETLLKITESKDKLQTEYKENVKMSLSYPDFPTDSGFTNLESDIYKAWHNIVLIQDMQLGGFKFLYGDVQSSFLGIYKTGVWQELRNIVSRLSAKLELKVNGWAQVRCVISDLDVIEHNGKYYVDSVRLLFAFTPIRKDAIPFQFSSKAGSYGGPMTLAIRTAIILLIRMSPILLLMGVGTVLVNAVTSGIKNVVDIPSSSAGKVESLIVSIGVVAIGILILLYYLNHRS